jgi:hypothetical protein
MKAVSKQQFSQGGKKHGKDKDQAGKAPKVQT